LSPYTAWVRAVIHTHTVSTYPAIPHTITPLGIAD
jgi:hypothetical protein